MGKLHDLEKRVRYLEKELDASRKLFQSVADEAPEVICRFNLNFEHLYVNPALTKATGIPIKKFIGNTPHKAGLPPPMADFWIHTLSTVLKRGKHMTVEFSFPTPVGERHFQSLIVPEIDTSGETHAVLTWTRDITDIKEQQRRGDEMFGVVSHELKTPLTSLKAFTHLLQKRFQQVGDIENISLVGKMENQINRLNSLIEDGLSTTKTDAGGRGGGFQFRERNFSMDTLIKEVVAEFQVLNPKQTIAITGQTKRKCHADRDRVGQVLINLLSNAIKYSPEGSKVVVKISSTKNRVKCCVIDSGVGIPKNMQEKIFDRYFRVNATRANNPPGLGLGLYISKEIIQRLGGTIWVDSKRGKGSSFCLTLPTP